jgi:multicomponent Na+:H+ antiporter subunit D
LSDSTLLFLIFAVPFLSAMAIAASHANGARRDRIALGGGILLFLLVAILAVGVSWDAPPRYVLAEPVADLPLALSVEPLGLIFALVASFLWPVTSVYAFGYMNAHGETHQTRFYSAFAVSLGAAMGIALADNMLTLFVFYELLTVATYPLVTHAGTEEARRAGRVYLGILMTTSIAFMLLAMVWTWNLTGTLDFTAGGILGANADHATAGILLLLFVLGTGKAALMPFHRWLPAAMVAPTPVSALLHAVAVVKAGVFTVLKVAVYVFGIDLIAELASARFLAYLAGTTVLIASLVAMTKDNLKARLAYSTISQLGYIVLGAMLGVAAGTVGGAMHIAMHAFGKITLFFCAGAILVAAHKTRVSELDGIGRQMPLTMGAFLIGALSIVGVPPMGGTWSKWVLVQGTLDAHSWALMAVLLVSSVLNVLYLVVIPVRAFVYSPPDNAGKGIREAPRQCIAAIAVTAIGCVLLFLAPDPLFRLAAEILK